MGTRSTGTALQIDALRAPRSPSVQRQDMRQTPEPRRASAKKTAQGQFAQTSGSILKRWLKRPSGQPKAMPRQLSFGVRDRSPSQCRTKFVGSGSKMAPQHRPRIRESEGGANTLSSSSSQIRNWQWRPWWPCSNVGKARRPAANKWTTGIDKEVPDTTV